MTLPLSGLWTRGVWTRVARDVHRGLGGLEERLPADAAGDVACGDVLVRRQRVSPYSTQIGATRSLGRTPFSCDLAVFLSFWLRSRFCAAFAPWLGVSPGAKSV